MKVAFVFILIPCCVRALYMPLGAGQHLTLCVATCLGLSDLVDYYYRLIIDCAMPPFALNAFAEGGGLHDLRRIHVRVPGRSCACA